MAKAMVRLHGGPANGRVLEYHLPLPKILVIPERSSHSTKFHDYERVATFDYRFREKKKK